MIDMALQKRVINGRNEWARKKLADLKASILNGTYQENAYTVFYNASCILPVLTGIADRDKALQMLDEVSFFTNKFGIYIAGIARPDDITLEECSVTSRLEGDFNYNEAIMQIATSNLAIAECRYGGFESARKYIEQILNNFSFATPGTTYEVSPDYGMFVQAWNVTGYNIPLIRYVFDVNPRAHEKFISVKTDIPSDWPYARLRDLWIGNNRLSIDYQRDAQRRTYALTCSEDGWQIQFDLPSDTRSVKVNGQAVSQASSLTLTSLRNTVEIEQGE